MAKGIRKCVWTAPAWKSNRESRVIDFDWFLKDRWLVARSVECQGIQYRWITGKFVNEVITSDVRALVVKSDQEVKFDQEVSIVGVQSSLMGDLHSVGGLSGASKVSPVGASAADAVMEKSVR